MARRVALGLGIALVLAGLGAVLWATRGGAHEGVVGPEGRNALEPEQASQPELAASAQGSALAPEREDALDEAGTDARFALEPDQPRPSSLIAVRVRVLDAARAQVPAEARLVASDGEHPPRDAPRQADGSFQLSLPPGAWTLVAEAPGHGAASREVELEPNDRRLELELALGRATSTAIVLVEPDGTRWSRRRALPLGLVRALATRAPPAARLEADALAALADGWSECGRFHAADAPTPTGRLGLLELGCEPPCVISLAVGREVLASRRVESAPSELRFELARSELAARTASVRLRCVDAASGAALSRAELRVAPQGCASFGMALRGGELVLDALPPGLVRLELVAAGYEPLVRELELEPGAEQDLGALALARPGSARIALELRAPAPLARARLRWCLAGGSGDASARELDPARELGPAQAELRPGRGTWLVWAEGLAEGGEVRSRRARVALGESDQRLALELAPLARLTLDPAEGPRSIALEDGEGAPALARASVQLAPRVLELAPGPYTLRVSGPGGLQERISLVLIPSGLRLRLP